MATNNDRVGLLSWEMQLDVHGFENKIKDSARSLSSMDKKGTKGLKNVERGFSLAKVAAGLFAISLTKLVHESVQLATAYDKIDNGLKTVFGSTEAAASELTFLTDISDDLGLSLRDSADGFIKVAAAAKGTSLEGKGVKEVFRGVAEASTALGLSADQSKGALTAISQIMSKGKVQAEELRGQLGERIPGAFQIAARAMKMTTAELDKMLERGELLAEDFLPKFAQQLRTEFSGAATEAANSIAANTNRMKNAWEGTLKGMGKIAADFFPLVTKGMKQFNEGVEEAIALRNKMLGIGEFDPAADEFFKRAATQEEILAAMTPRQRERARLAKMTAEERKAEANAVKSLAEAEKREKGLKTFREFGLGKAFEQEAERVKAAASLTNAEFSAFKPHIINAMKEGVKMKDIIKEAKEQADLFGDAINKGQKADLSALDEIDREQKRIEKEQERAAKDRRKKEIDFLNKKIAMQDPRQTAQRALAGGIEEFRILTGQDNTAKKSEKHLSAMKKRLEQLEAV